MNDADKIIAAIFAAQSLPRKSDPPAYLDAYEKFLAVIEERRKWAAQNKPKMKINPKVLERAKTKPPHRG
jgi:hypothetical protein